MNESALSALREQCEKLSPLRSRLTLLLTEPGQDGNQFDLNAPIPQVEATYFELDATLALVLEGLKPIIELKSTNLLPKSAIQALTQRLRELVERISTIENSLRANPINTINPPFIYTNTAGQQNNITAHLQSLSEIIDATLMLWGNLRAFAGAPAFSDFSELLAGFAERRSGIESLTASARSQASSVSALAVDAKVVVDAMRLQQGEMDRLVQQTDKLRTTASEQATEVNQKTEQIKALAAEANKLEAAVQSYQSVFDQFKAALDNRNSQFDVGSEQLNELQARLTSELERVADLKNQAEAMLVGSTNAGLASGYSKRVNELTKEVVWARRSYYASIVFLSLLSLPLVMFIIPKEVIAAILKSLPNFAGEIVGSVSPSASTPEHLAQVVARALLLVPGWLLVRFAAVRHERLFKLLEHYQDKCSLAASVEGCKKQAPDYESEVAAATFFELTNNPANSLDAKGPETRHPNRVIEWLLKKLDGKSDKAGQIPPPPQ